MAGGESLVIVVAGGDPPAPDAAQGLLDRVDRAFVIAADSGLDNAVGLGLAVDLVVGDLDSVRPETLAAAEARGTVVERHPEAKDQTDLELALDRAAERRPDRIVVLGGGGGRADHLLAGALLLASERYEGVPTIDARLGPARVTVVRAGPEAGRRGDASGELRGGTATRLVGAPGDLVSLLPAHGPARGVTTEGLLYPLSDEDLLPGSTRGVSNELVAGAARVRLRQGTLLAVQPGVRGTHLGRVVPPSH